MNLTNPFKPNLPARVNRELASLDNLIFDAEHQVQRLTMELAYLRMRQQHLQASLPVKSAVMSMVVKP